MKAIAYYASLPINDEKSLQDIQLPEPVAGPRDLLVEVKAISVNPVDTKVRQNVAPENGAAKVLGWDVAGVVKAVGSEVSLFKVGDHVFYAGSLIRPGANSELHTVDERIVGHMPKSLGFAEAAALPLTAITAWELLFERLQVREGKQDEGQGSDFDETKALLKKGYLMLEQLIENTSDGGWNETVDTPFFGTVSKARLFAHILYHNSYHAGQIGLTLKRA